MGMARVSARWRQANSPENSGLTAGLATPRLERTRGRSAAGSYPQISQQVVPGTGSTKPVSDARPVSEKGVWAYQPPPPPPPPPPPENPPPPLPEDEPGGVAAAAMAEEKERPTLRVKPPRFRASNCPEYQLGW